VNPGLGAENVNISGKKIGRTIVKMREELYAFLMEYIF
jgi:hypothetical protein